MFQFAAAAGGGSGLVGCVNVCFPKTGKGTHFFLALNTLLFHLTISVGFITIKQLFDIYTLPLLFHLLVSVWFPWNSDLIYIHAQPTTSHISQPLLKRQNTVNHITSGKGITNHNTFLIHLKDWDKNNKKLNNLEKKKTGKAKIRNSELLAASNRCKAIYIFSFKYISSKSCRCTFLYKMCNRAYLHSQTGGCNFSALRLWSTLKPLTAWLLFWKKKKKWVVSGG